MKYVQKYPTFKEIYHQLYYILIQPLWSESVNEPEDNSSITYIVDNYFKNQFIVSAVLGVIITDLIISIQ